MPFFPNNGLYRRDIRPCRIRKPLKFIYPVWHCCPGRYRGQCSHCAYIESQCQPGQWHESDAFNFLCRTSTGITHHNNHPDHSSRTIFTCRGPWRTFVDLGTGGYRYCVGIDFFILFDIVYCASALRNLYATFKTSAAV